MKMEKAIDSLKPLAERLSNLELHNNPNLYVNWLTQTYFFVCHSVPLLRIAANTGTDAAFRKRCLEHMKEEGGHDKVALSDLKELRVPVENLREWDWTRSFYQRQYRLTQERGELLLGYILALEGLAILAEPVVPPLIEAYGQRATKFAKIHVEEDQDHLPQAIGQTMKLECRDEIIANFYKVVEEYKVFLENLDARKHGLAAA